jgi:hypothetical protein
MSENKSVIAREKLARLTADLKRAAEKLGVLAQGNLPEEDLLAIGALNDRVAVYLQDIILMVVDTRDLDIDAVVEFVDLVEHFVAEIDGI